MSNIGGKLKETRELPEFKKSVGLFEARVVAINPTAEEYKELLNIELKEDSKATDYLSKNDDDVTVLRIDVWLEHVKNKEKFKVAFYLKDKECRNRDNTKKQYINNVGTTTWADDPNNLPDWFTGRDYRVAFDGESELYGFLRTWLGKLDYREAETVLQLDWKPLMKGNTKDLKNLVGGAYTTNIVALATVKTVVREDGTKEYQSVYNRGFLPAYSLKNFRLVNYSDEKVLKPLREKKKSMLKPHERFAVDVTGEYGCKEFYILRDLQEYNAESNFVASDRPIANDDASY